VILKYDQDEIRCANVRIIFMEAVDVTVSPKKRVLFTYSLLI